MTTTANRSVLRFLVPQPCIFSPSSFSSSSSRRCTTFPRSARPTSFLSFLDAPPEYPPEHAAAPLFPAEHAFLLLLLLLSLSLLPLSPLLLPMPLQLSIASSFSFAVQQLHSQLCVRLAASFCRRFDTRSTIPGVVALIRHRRRDQDPVAYRPSRWWQTPTSIALHLHISFPWVRG